MKKMKHVFYDTKLRKKVEEEVIGKREYRFENKIRYSLFANSSDGRSLWVFCNKDTYDRFSNVKNI